VKMTRSIVLSAWAVLLAAVLPPGPTHGQAGPAPGDLDARVRGFLDRARGDWHDLNVPYEDGQALHDLIVKKGFTRGLEIGTSTGHSGIWIAWAMSKTGGKLVTIEIDEKAYAYLARVGYDPVFGARPLKRAIQREVETPVARLIVAGKLQWYTQYFKDLEAKVPVGGCFTAHNVLDGFAGVDAFLDYVRARPNYTTTIERTSRSGISVSCRTK